MTMMMMMMQRKQPALQRKQPRTHIVITVEQQADLFRLSGD
jgi:hypothetical protein